MTLRILGGRFKGRILQSPKGSATRPTQGILRQAVFNMCQHEIEGAHFLDLFAGSGAMGFEALSRGASSAVLVEQNRFAIRAIRENILSLQVEEQTKLIPQNASLALKSLEKQHLHFHFIYIDPPYGDPAFLHDILSKLEKAMLFAPNCKVLIETSSKMPKISYTSSLLTQCDERSYGIARLTQFVFTKIA